jgi:hypothetical protein
MQLPDSQWMTALTDKPPESRRPDPLRREPPTLDLKAKEVKPDLPKRSGSVPPAPAAKGAASPAKPATTSAAPPQKAAPAASAPRAGDTGLAAASTASARPADEAPVRRRPSITGDASSATAAPTGAAMPSAKPMPTASATAAPSRPATDADTKPAPESAKPSVQRPDAAAPPPRRSGIGFGGLATTGLLGGLIGAGLALGAERYLQAQGFDPQARATDSRIAALEQRVASAQGAAPAVGGDTAALERRIGALEGANRNLTEAVAAARSSADAARQAGANRPAGATAPAVSEPDPALRDAVAGLTTRLSALEETARQSGAAAQANTGALAEIRSQLGALRTSLEQQTRQGTATAQTNAAALAELTTQVGSVQTQAAAQAAAATTALQAMQGRLAENEQRLASLSEQFTRFGPQAAQAGIRVIVANRATDALRDGVPVGPVLTTLQRTGTPQTLLEPLRPYADTAPPSPAALARDFEPLAARIAEAARGPATTIGDRLMRMADRIVTVRDVGETGGTDVGAQVGRIEKALARGALGEAAAAWDGLPDDAKRISAEWATRLKQRAAAEDAARRISAEALSAIDASLR